MKQHLPRLAIFIDADNLGLKVVPQVLAQLSKSWDTSYRRAYGINLRGNEVTFRENSVFPVEVLCNSPGKNSTDIALVIDAMEELCQGSCEAICIVSGDGDFTRLVQRVREKGKTAIVFGKSTTPVALRSACSEFYVIDPSKSHQNSKKTSNAPPPPASKAGEREAELHIRNGLRRVFSEFQSEYRMVSLERFGEYLKRKHPELSPKKSGFGRLKPFLIRIGGFKIEPSPKSDGITGMFQVTLPVKELSGILKGNSVGHSPPVRIVKSDDRAGK